MFDLNFDRYSVCNGNLNNNNKRSVGRPQLLVELPGFLTVINLQRWPCGGNCTLLSTWEVSGCRYSWSGARKGIQPSISRDSGQPSYLLLLLLFFIRCVEQQKVEFNVCVKGTWVLGEIILGYFPYTEKHNVPVQTGSYSRCLWLQQTPSCLWKQAPLPLCSRAPQTVSGPRHSFCKKVEWHLKQFEVGCWQLFIRDLQF